MIDFTQLKTKVPLADAIERYTGQTPNRGKVCCPFHDDKHPSMQLKNEQFHCYVCDLHGDVIHFVARYFSESILDAVKRLDQDFALGVLKQNVPSTPMQRKAHIARAQARKTEKPLDQSFEDWCTETHERLASMYKILDTWRAIYAPCIPGEPLQKRFVFALHTLDGLEWMLDEMRNNRKKTYRALYSAMKNKKGWIYEKCRLFETELNTGRTSGVDAL